MKPIEITQTSYKKIEETAKEAMRGIGQLYMSIGELSKVDMGGERNLGIYRMREVAKVFTWCGVAINRIADKLEEQNRENGRKDEQ